MSRTLLILLAAVAFSSTSSLAVTTRTVDNHSLKNTTAPCTKATYTSINSAVAASAPGDTVQVCPGTYSETLKLTKPITISGITSGNNLEVVLQPSAGTATTELDSGSNFPGERSRSCGQHAECQSR